MKLTKLPSQWPERRGSNARLLHSRRLPGRHLSVALFQILRPAGGSIAPLQVLPSAGFPPATRRLPGWAEPSLPQSMVQQGNHSLYLQFAHQVARLLAEHGQPEIGLVLLAVFLFLGTAELPSRPLLLCLWPWSRIGGSVKGVF